MPMIKTSKTVLAVTVLFAAVLVSGPAHAFGPEKGGPPDGFFRALRILDLSDSQKEAIAAIRDQAENSITPLKEQIDDVDLLSAMLAETIDTETVNQKAAQMQELMSQIGQIRMNAHLEIAQVLTAEQRTQLLDFMEKMKALRQAFKGKRNQ